MAPEHETGGEQRDESLRGGFSALFHAIRTSIHDSAELVALEARRAAIGLAVMVAAALAAALFAVTAWFLLVAAILVWIVNSTDTGWGAVLVGAALVNLLACVPLVLVLKSRSRHLLFEASRRQFGRSPSQPTTGTDDGKITGSLNPAR